MKKSILLIICLLLFAVSAKSQTVSYAEYFIDVDSGLGNGTPIPFTTDSIISLDSIVVNTSTLSLGYHWIYVRVKDSDGKWSLYTSKRFYVFDNSPIQAINDTVVLSEAAYIIADSIPHSWQGTTVNNFTPDDIVAYLDSIQGLVLPVGQHTISLRVRDSKGFWSYPMTTTFNVCPTAEPFASYDYYVSGYDLILDNTSTSQDSCTWYFGDGDTSNQVDLVHHYDTAGVYNVQLISKNSCTYNTLSKSVVVKGINSISPDNGGNIGVVTMTITGAGFTGSTTVKLVKSGEPDIIPFDSSTAIINGTSIQTSFDLSGVATGLWDIIIEVPGDTIFTVIEGFQVDTGKIFSLKINLIGPKFIRNFRKSQFTVTVTNLSNVDAISVPVWIAIPQGNIIFEKNFEVILPTDTVYDWDTLAQNVPVDTLFNIFSPYSVYGYKISFIPAGGSINLSFYLTPSATQNFEIKYWVSNPVHFTDSSQLRILNSISLCAHNPSTFQCMLDLLGTFVGTISPEVNCAAQFLSFNVGVFYTSICHPENLNATSIVLDLAAAFGSCAVGFNPWDRFNKARKALQVLLNLYSPSFSNGFGFSCLDAAILPEALGSEGAYSLASYDPNEKYGSSGVFNSPYLNSQAAINYSLHCENADTATAPAQTVIMTDTLDDFLDLTTLQLTSFGFGDTIVFIPSGKKSFSADINLQPNLPLIARFSGYLNDSTKVLTAKFQSLDPLTMEPTTNPLLGFLLPNDLLGRGEAFVSFSIRAKDSIFTGTVVNNKADIYFDENLPITTSNWTNIIDNLKPQSNVNTLSATTVGDTIIVNWTSNDYGPAGVYTYNIYYQVNNGAWQLWKYNTSLLTEKFAGVIDSTYGFYCVAIDSALNVEDAPPAADASTTITVGIEDIEQTQMIVRLFPNPANSTLNIFIKRFAKSQNDFSIIARDVTGRTVKNEKLNITSETRTVQIDISQFVSGIYFFEITDGKHRTFKKLIKN